jgi:glutathione synthase/RimK-type ligase-like ATP-grasp enzyme
LLSAHARYARHTALACGYAFASLDGEDGYLFEVRDGARAALFSGAAGSPYALNDARAAALARDKAFAALALQRAGLPTVPGRMFFVTEAGKELRSPGRELEDALAYASAANYPLFCKPISASKGDFAEIIADAAAFAAYTRAVATAHYAILVQPYIGAPEYRVFVLEGFVLCSYRKQPATLVGDGARTLSALAGRAGVRAHDQSGTLLDELAVLPAGEHATLQGAANRARGGGATELRDGALAALGRLASAAVGLLGLRFAGVDLFAAADGPMIIEVNAAPMIATLEEQGRWDLIEAIWRANFVAALR